MADHVTFRCIRATNGKVDLVYTSLAECLQTNVQDNRIHIDVLVDGNGHRNLERDYDGRAVVLLTCYRIICRRVETCERRHYTDMTWGIRWRLIPYIRYTQHAYSDVYVIKYPNNSFDVPCDITLDDPILLDLRRHWYDELKKHYS